VNKRWVFDKPVWRDWLLWVALAGAVATSLVPLTALKWYRTMDRAAVSLTLTMALLFLAGFLIVVVFCSVAREFVRGRADKD